MNTRIDKALSEEMYRIYITDALKAIADNTAKFAGGSSMKKRWFDMVHRVEPDAPEDACEVVSAVIEKAGIEVT